jgi:hypothetical protein
VVEKPGVRSLEAFVEKSGWNRPGSKAERFNAISWNHSQFFHNDMCKNSVLDLELGSTGIIARGWASSVFAISSLESILGNNIIDNILDNKTNICFGISAILGGCG